MGTSMSEGTIIAWLKAVGDEVAADESICEISTDKVDSEIPAPAAGTLAEILVEAGQVVEVGVTLGRIATEGPPPSSSGNGKAKSGNGKATRFYSPVARRLAEDRGIDLDQVVGTGRNGRVTKRDVEGFAATA
ncbi:MAG: E3 binding domain-containing protein, partial [Actinobacteria bacterium]|nr:E3 binding domain-containing protein [Actinomycetota bacterium]